MAGDGYVGYAAWCEVHGRKAFQTRKDARRAIRHMHGSRMREYRCHVLCGLWHVGHLPLAVAAGLKTAADVYGPRP